MFLTFFALACEICQPGETKSMVKAGEIILEAHWRKRDAERRKEFLNHASSSFI